MLGVLAWMLRRDETRRRWPLNQIRRQIYPLVPVVAVLGLIASLLEGAGVGLLIPLLSVLLAKDPSAGLSGPLRALAHMFGGYDPEARAILLGTAILALVVLKGLVQIANQSLLGSIQARIGREIRSGMARSLLAVDYPFFLHQDSARLTRVVSTDSWFVVQAARSVLDLIPAVAGLLVFAALLALLNLKLFLIIVLGGALVQGLIYLFERRQRWLSFELTESNRLLWQRMLTLLQAPRVIRLFGQERREQERADSAIERVRWSVRTANYVNAIAHPAVDALVALLFLTVLLAGYWNGMSVPAITAFLLLLTRAQPHAKAIASARLGIASFQSSVREVDWLLLQANAAPDKNGASEGARLDRPISFENVSFVYPNGSSGLDSVTLTIEPGIATALIGQSGSGKTTLVNLLCRLFEPQSGQIRLGADSISQYDVAGWRKHIAVAGQDTDLVTGTVAENIAYGRPDAHFEEIEAVARAVGADTFIDALPQGYDTLVGPQGLNLSGGQRQRIGVARALLLNPDLLILDEAVSAVDALSDLEIVRLASDHRFFRTLLIISHRKTTISACERGIVLNDGRVTEAGRLEDLAYFRSMAGSPAAMVDQ
jgi:subfamily B ATP-binding cassette protein MsbA